MSSRCVSMLSESLAIERLRRSERQCQGEGGALVAPGTLRLQRATELLGCERAAVQPETMSVAAGREAVIEDALQILLRDADPGVGDGNQDRAGVGADAHGDAFFTARHLVAGVLGVAD